jgi:hypothetical protein
MKKKILELMGFAEDITGKWYLEVEDVDSGEWLEIEYISENDNFEVSNGQVLTWDEMINDVDSGNLE